ncbi:MAG: sensor histidine kinase [Desulfobulbaceae bacterium]|nr:MAG: sensor histidine kinase [Desulfobulbaceae bacterium]
MRAAKFLAIRSISGWITILAILVLILFFVSTVTYKIELKNYSDEGSIRLELFITYLRGVLEKYENLPELLAGEEQVATFLNETGNSQRIEYFNKYLEEFNNTINASDTYLMDKAGFTVAASNWRKNHSFVGKNFSYRPYFTEAIGGATGRYFALGTTSEKRGYYFAYPVKQNGEVLGAVVIKTNIDTVEKQWGYHDQTFIVTDPEDFIFLSTNPLWRFKSLGIVDPSIRRQVEQSKRYSDRRLLPLTVQRVKDYDFGSVINVYGDANEYKTYLRQHKFMEEAGWYVHILSNIRPIRGKILQVNIYVSFIILVSYLCLVLFTQRRQRLAELKLFEEQARKVLQEANEKLESRVHERTHELTEANRKLLIEIQERKNTEIVLNRTRSELVHAAKMATLGQLSAGINHELNQPLAAIRSYADNSIQLLEKDRTVDAVSNLEQISELTERMAQIGLQLKVFSRKTSGQKERLSLQGVIDGALEIILPSVKKHNIDFQVDFTPPYLHIIANQVLMQQVFVNVFSNAIHAIENRNEKWIKINAQKHNGFVEIVIEDSGEGIDESIRGRVFEPFCTTKKSGEGLGLGLTITQRILNEMSGTIDLEQHITGRGAIFTIIIPSSE